MPGRAADLSGLPPAYIAVAGHDPLRDDGVRYGELLAAAGVPVEVHNAETLVHGYLGYAGIVPAATEAADLGLAALGLHCIRTSPTGHRRHRRYPGYRILFWRRTLISVDRWRELVTPNRHRSSIRSSSVQDSPASVPQSASTRLAFRDYQIIEAGEEPGGTWYWNTYPGIAVDIPSFSYQFSFEQSADWSRTYAPGRELKAYADHCVDKYQLAQQDSVQHQGHGGDVRRRKRLLARRSGFWRIADVPIRHQRQLGR